MNIAKNLLAHKPCHYAFLCYHLIMFDSLSSKLQEIIRNTGAKELTQDNMQDALREIRRALLDADVNLRVVKSFISSIRDKAEGENIVQGVNASQQLIKIVNDELVSLLGKEVKPLEFRSKPSLIMMLGLQGSGKTTSSAKLAIKLKKDGRNPVLVACDVYRPAAITQLKTLGQECETEVFSIEGSTDVQGIVKAAIEYASTNNFDTLILDTAGRLQIDTEMMAELLLIDRLFHPDEKLLVIDAMVGQESVNVAENFDAQLGLTGLVLTKLDGDSRGGAALSVVHCTGKPIKLTGTGEKLNALEDFHPDRMATRILGMGDIVSLVEKAQNAYDEAEALKLQRKIAKNQFDFNDYLNQINQIKKMGNLKDLASMIPGVGKAIKDMDIDDNAFKGIEAIIHSMTAQERANPSIINSSRRQRIARGSGTTIVEVNRMMKQFDQMRKMMKMATSIKNPMKMMKQMRNQRPH